MRRSGWITAAGSDLAGQPINVLAGLALQRFFDERTEPQNNFIFCQYVRAGSGPRDRVDHAVWLWRIHVLNFIERLAIRDGSGALGA